MILRLQELELASSVAAQEFSPAGDVQLVLFVNTSAGVVMT